MSEQADGKQHIQPNKQMISPVLVSRRCSATVQFKCNNKRVFIRRLHLIRARSSSPPVISSIYFVRVRRRSSTKEFAPLLSHVQRGQSTIILVLREGSRLSSSLTRQSCCSLWFTNHKRRFFCPRERQSSCQLNEASLLSWFTNHKRRFFCPRERQS